MSVLEIRGTVTQRSNGVIRIAPVDGAPASRIEIHEGALSSKQLPDMGDEVTVAVSVTKTAAEAEKTAAEKAAVPVTDAQADAPAISRKSK